MIFNIPEDYKLDHNREEKRLFDIKFNINQNLNN